MVSAAPQKVSLVVTDYQVPAIYNYIVIKHVFILVTILLPDRQCLIRIKHFQLRTAFQP